MGRHKRTFTYGVTSKTRKYQLYSSLTPRDALAFDMNDVKRILKEDKLYNKETRNVLSNYIKDYKEATKSNGIFKKSNNNNNRTLACAKKSFK